MGNPWFSYRATGAAKEIPQEYLDQCAAAVQHALDTRFSEEFNLFQQELGEALADSLVFGEDFDAKAEAIIANFNRRMAQFDSN
jgi:hypothetical protein